MFQNFNSNVYKFYNNKYIFPVGVMYSGEYDVCDVTLSVYPHWASLTNMPGHSGNRTYDLWNTSPMLCQLSYAVRSVRVYDISELSLVPSIQCNPVIMIFCVGVMYSGEYYIYYVTLSVYPHWTGLRNMPGHGENQTYDLWNTSSMLCQLSYAVRSGRFEYVIFRN